MNDMGVAMPTHHVIYAPLKLYTNGPGLPYSGSPAFRISRHRAIADCSRCIPLYHDGWATFSWQINMNQPEDLAYALVVLFKQASREIVSIVFHKALEAHYAKNRFLFRTSNRYVC